MRHCLDRVWQQAHGFRLHREGTDVHDVLALLILAKVVFQVGNPVVSRWEDKGEGVLCAHGGVVEKHGGIHDVQGRVQHSQHLPASCLQLVANGSVAEPQFQVRLRLMHAQVTDGVHHKDPRYQVEMGQLIMPVFWLCHLRSLERVESPRVDVKHVQNPQRQLSAVGLYLAFEGVLQRVLPVSVLPLLDARRQGTGRVLELREPLLPGAKALPQLRW
mmetsp:Transcript_50699/g.121085  ORF Transcript_50699/g.121085 Transcript_50699/m.121085 type:complete len:217 (+) Transcript_50699:1023-1673(+)